MQAIVTDIGPTGYQRTHENGSFTLLSSLQNTENNENFATPSKS